MPRGDYSDRDDNVMRWRCAMFPGHPPPEPRGSYPSQHRRYLTEQDRRETIVDQPRVSRHGAQSEKEDRSTLTLTLTLILTLTLTLTPPYLSAHSSPRHALYTYHIVHIETDTIVTAAGYTGYSINRLQ